MTADAPSVIKSRKPGSRLAVEPQKRDEAAELWSSIVRDVKESVWGVIRYEPDEFYTVKYYLGDVVPDWSNTAWLTWRWELTPKRGTRACYTSGSLRCKTIKT